MTSSSPRSKAPEPFFNRAKKRHLKSTSTLRIFASSSYITLCWAHTKSNSDGEKTEISSKEIGKRHANSYEAVRYVSRPPSPVPLADKEKKSPAIGQRTSASSKQQLTTSSSESQAPHPTTPTTKVSNLTDAFNTTMSLPRQDSFFKIAIIDCGPQGVPPSPDGHVYDTKELAQLIETTTFTVDATADIAKTWLAWLKNVGDENAAWVRELAITVQSGVEVRVRISPPLIRGEVSRAKVEVSGDVQKQERLHGDLVKWLNRAVEDVREKRRLLHGGGEFSRKEIHKIAKVVFRVPAVVHELVGRYERGEGLGSCGEGETNEESAIEDSDEEMALRGLVGSVGGVQKEKVEKKKKKPKSLAQAKKEAFISDELAFREHARSCSTCDCKWVESLDGISEVYAHRVAKSGGKMNLVFAKCGTAVDVSCTTTAKDPTPAAKDTLPSNTRLQ